MSFQKRRVLYRSYNKYQKQKDATNPAIKPEDRGYTKHYGWLAGYGLDSIESETSVASHTVCIIEGDDNTIKLIYPNDVIIIP